MRRRVVSFCAALLFITYSIICGPTYASGIWTVDENVDPWADLQEMDGQSGGEEVDEPDDFSSEDGIGFSAVTSDGETVEDFLPLTDDGIAPFASLSSFDLSCRTDGTLAIAHAGIVSGAGSGAYLSYFNTKNLSRPSLPLSWAELCGYDFPSDSYAMYYYSSSSSYEFFLEFTDLIGSGVETISLSGSLGASLMWNTIASNGNKGNLTSFYMNSCQLVYYVEGRETPVIASSFSVSSTGSASLSQSNIPINASVTSIGLRMIFNNVTSTSVGYVRTSINSRPTRLFWGLNIGKPQGTYEGSPGLGEIAGLLDGLIALVQGIYNTVMSIPATLSNIVSAITQLPGKIADAISSLFVPTDAQMQELSSKYNGLFEEKLGFIYQMFSFVVDAFGSIKDTLASVSDYSFHFPGISFPMNGEVIVIIPEQDVSLDNAVMDVLRPVLGTIVTIACTLGVIGVAFDMVLAIMSGETYWGFISEKREELDI